MDIYVGKDNDSSRLRIILSVDGTYLSALVPGAAPVPATVSRCRIDDQGQPHAHCMVANDGEEWMVTNLRAPNKTFVDGVSVARKRVSGNTRVALGSDQYEIDLGVLLRAAENLVVTQCDIRPLEQVYQRYQDTCDRIERNRNRWQKLRIAIPSTVSALGVVLGLLLGDDNRALSAFLGLLPGLLTLPIVFRKETYTEERRKAKEELIHSYVCPNTGKFLGMKAYIILKQEDRCPHCKKPRNS